ncbi:MAG: glycosyltransferase family 2 protein [Demequinaceae bacterium]|nr:glycosyltransferase family 2 protein [Demequinaceae bacterium]
MSSGPPTAVDVVVVTYNPGGTLDRFLDSVATAGEGMSVTVVDSASAEKTAEETASRRKVGFLAMPSNRGYGAAANAGAALGSAPWIAVCNADIEFSPGALSVLVEAGEGSGDIGAVGPLIRNLDGTLYPSARPLPSLGTGMGHAVFGRVWPRNPWTRKYRAGLDPEDGRMDAGWLSGSCLLVRREAFEKVGGFDEGFFMFMEDVDLGRRLGITGYRNRWVPESVITHIGGHTWKSDPAPMIRAHHASVRRYLSIVYPGAWRAPLRGLLKLGLGVRQRIEVAAARRARAD